MNKMSQVSPVFTEYEQRVLRDIAVHKVQPHAVQRILDTVGKPFGKLLHAGRDSKSRALRGATDRIHRWVEEGLIKTFKAANRITNPQEVTKRYEARGVKVEDIDSVRYLPLSMLDEVADSFKFRNGLLVGVEGALLGGATTLAEGIPGAQLIIPSLILTDITTSLTLLSRHTCQLANAYGFSSRVPGNLPHMIAAMAPQSEAGDEGYVALKTAVVTSISESGRFLARSGGMLFDRHVLEAEAPQMIRLITYVADRLGVVLTEKELGIIVPVAGAVLNSSLNVAFQQLGHQTTKDYFRRLILEDRYGEEIVSYAIAQEVAVLKAPRSNPGNSLSIKPSEES
jgi:hypothetical protein